VLFHELGHALPVMLLTREGAIIYIGSYGNEKHSFKLTFGKLDIWFRYNPIGWQGGICIPKAEEIPLNRQFIYIISGPIFSFCIASILFYLTFAYNLHGSLKLICAFAFGSTILDLFSNLIPRRIMLKDGSTIYSDGYYLYHINNLKKFPKECFNAIEYYNNNDYENSARMFKALISNNIVTEDIYRHAYVSCMFIQDYESALNILKEMKYNYEINSDDYYNFGVVCNHLKLNEEKTKYYKKSIELNPDNSYTLNAIGYELNSQREYETAITYFEQAIKIENEFAYAFNNRGHAKIEMGKLEEGLADINFSLELDKENSYAYRNLGIYYLKTKNYNKALNEFKKAKEMNNQTDLIDELIMEATVNG
jgi:tetratricopeptide (TPR) repeat protein